MFKINIFFSIGKIIEIALKIYFNDQNEILVQYRKSSYKMNDQKGKQVMLKIKKSFVIQ